MTGDRCVLPMGDRAWLVEMPDLDGALALFEAVRSADLPGVAALVGISEREVIARHTAATYRVAFGGFAPGFAYLTGGDPLFDVPRRSSPRTRIAPGSVALAGRFSAVYPRASPGGWQLIGRTDQVMWRLDRDPPAALQPGDRVRFVDVTGPDAPRPDAEPEARATASARDSLGRTISRSSIPAPRPYCKTTDAPGLAAMGIPESGALDRFALHQANRLVGNPTGTAAIEFSFGGAVRAIGDVVVSVSSERTSVQVDHSDGRLTTITQPAPVQLHDGDTLTITAERGPRTLAARGGFDVPAVLGSRSTDVLSGIGPDPLVAGARLAIASPTGPATVAEPEPWPDRVGDDVVELPVIVGPRDDWFADVDDLFARPWTVTAQSNRVGLRLRGDQPLTRAITNELPSEGMVAGAVQVPPDGQPGLFLADHPVTGGYPVIAVLHSSALDRAGQLTPDRTIRFVRALGSRQP